MFLLTSGHFVCHDHSAMKSASTNTYNFKVHVLGKRGQCSIADTLTELNQDQDLEWQIFYTSSGNCEQSSGWHLYTGAKIKEQVKGVAR